jgi:hypothetical protein
MIEFDEDLYPTDESVEAMIDALSKAVLGDGHRSLARSCFDAFVKGCFYASGGLAVVDVRGEAMLVYEFHTGGWSGCETFIWAMKEMRSMVWMMYFERMDSGGHYYLDLASDEEKRAWAADGAIMQDPEPPVLTDVVERRRSARKMPWESGSRVVFGAAVAAMLAIVFALKWTGVL